MNHESFSLPAYVYAGMELAFYLFIYLFIYSSIHHWFIYWFIMFLFNIPTSIAEELMRLPLEKMVAISQATLSNALL